MWLLLQPCNEYDFLSRVKFNDRESKLFIISLLTSRLLLAKIVSFSVIAFNVNYNFSGFLIESYFSIEEEIRYFLIIFFFTS